MKSKKKSGVFCPCCKTSLHRSEFSSVVKTLTTATGFEVFDNFLEYEFGYACDNCLTKQKAILANPKLQLGSHFQHLAYFDESHTCQTCGDDYIFSKEEKRHWFEVLQFWVYAESLNCKNCSKEIRVERNLNTRLSNLLKNGEEELSNEQITEVISIYQTMEKAEKVKYFQSKLR